MNRLPIIAIIILFCSSLFAQEQQLSYEDFVPISGEHQDYDKKAINERPVIEYPFLQEADVKFQKRVHRVIDTRQRMNNLLNWPKNPLHQYIHGFAIDGLVKPYVNDSLYSWMSAEDAKKVGSNTYSIEVPNPDGDPDDPFDVIIEEVTDPFESYKITKYMLLEDWFFDHKHSVMKPRILAIAPLYMLQFGGQDIGEVPMFWIKMEELRPLLVNLELFNTQNDATRMSYDHFFQYRMFDSYIVKESNMYDLFINEFEQFRDDKMAALLESERIKNDLFIFEHDLWEY